MADKSGLGTLVTEEHELGTSALDLFSDPPMEGAQLAAKEQTVYLTTPLNNHGPYEFIVPNDSTDFIQLDQTELYGQVSVTKADGTALDVEQYTSVVNNFPQSLFKQVELYLNGTCVTDLSTPMYAYKAYLENHLSYGNDIKETTLYTRELYLKDTAGDEGDGQAELSIKDKLTTTGIGKRLSVLTKPFSFNMKLHVDFLGSVRYLIPGVEMKFKLLRNSDTFSLIAKAAGCKIEIKKLELKIRRIVVDPKVGAALEAGLDKSPAKYPIALSKLNMFQINSTTQSLQIPNVIRGKLPRSLLFGFVRADAYDGLVTRNPFVFQHFTLNYLNVYINGDPLHPIPIQPDWDDNNCVNEYVRFLNNIGMHQTHTNGLTLKDYKENTCLFAYDLSPDLCNSFYRHPTEHGIFDISLSFKTALTTNVKLITYATYDETVLIDKNRNVSFAT